MFPKDLDCGCQPDDVVPDGDVLSEVKDLEYVYEDGTKALHGVNFELRKGEVLALLGTNGVARRQWPRFSTASTNPPRAW